MGKEQTFAGIQSAYLFHIRRRELKIKDIKVLFHSFFVNGFRNDDNTFLSQKPQCNLSNRFAVFGTDFLHGFVMEKVVAAFGKRPQDII